MLLGWHYQIAWQRYLQVCGATAAARLASVHTPSEHMIAGDHCFIGTTAFVCQTCSA